MAQESSTQRQLANLQDWSQFRQQMPIARTWAYFDHAAVAPLPQPSLEAISKWANEAATQGDAVWPSWRQLHEQCRDSAARLINASSEEIALVPNTTFGINLVADGLDWQSGDNVVIPDHEFPSNVYPWLALESRGVEVRRVPLDGHKICIDRIVEACDERTRVVSVSWIGYASGCRIDPKAMASAVHDAGALFFLDAIQGLGVFPLDVRDADIDFLAADGHKWMLGPEGAGVFYVKSELLEQLRPINVGWNSVKHRHDFSKVELDLELAAARFEGGTQNQAGFIALGASLDLLAEYGLTHNQSPVAKQVLKTSDTLCDALMAAGATVHSDREPDFRSGIVLFELAGHEPMVVRSAMLENMVNVSCRGGHVRAAVHCYNDGNDIDRLIETIGQLKQ